MDENELYQRLTATINTTMGWDDDPKSYEAALRVIQRLIVRYKVPSVKRSLQIVENELKRLICEKKKYESNG